MPRTMNLPKIGVNMTEAIIDEWFVKEGDTISEGDAIFLAETDKATQDIYATDSGIVGKLLAVQGDKVQINQPIMVLLDDGEELTEDKAQTEGLAEEVPKVLEKLKNVSGTPDKASAPKSAPVVKKNEPRVRISPLAKKLAKERDINIADLKPSKPGERIVKADILAFKPAATPAAVKPAVLDVPENNVIETIPMTGIRKLIARKMSESNIEKPCAALTLTACTDEMIALRERYKARGIKVSYNDILVRIVSQALSDHRNINAVLDGEEIKMLRPINVGVAVDSERGLMVPVIKDADQKSLRQIADDFKAKVTAIQDSSIDADDLTGGTFTITNLGMFKIEQFVPIINPPECCILAVGAMKKEFVPDVNDQPMLVNNMKLTLVFDHRIVDGAPAAKFLQSVKNYIECPELLL